MRGGVLYPSVASRLRNLIVALGVGQVDVLLAVRQSAAFMTSLYGQRLFSKRYVAFAEFIADVDPAALQWSGLSAAERWVQRVASLCAGGMRIIHAVADRGARAGAALGGPDCAVSACASGPVATGAGAA